jgi:hypothetical protein
LCSFSHVTHQAELYIQASAAYAEASGYASGYDPTRRRAKGIRGSGSST